MNREIQSADTETPAHSAAFGPALPNGTLIAGRYEVRAFLGLGGMGIVYEAHDLELNESVALKLLRSDLTDAPEMLERFRTEVRLARRVTHRNVARTFDIGDDDGKRFLTMELVKGEALSNLLDRHGHLERPRALSIATQIASGMAAAHEAGVVHRDLKPENVTIADDGRVVIMDFGIASTTLVGETTATTAGAWGTPAYMSPEQVLGDPIIDTHADVYAFGAILYEMLTGHAAWSAETPLLVATARLTSPPPDARVLLPDLPDALANLILRCMAREQSERFSSGSLLLTALEGLDARTSSTAPHGEPEAPKDATEAAASLAMDRKASDSSLRPRPISEPTLVWSQLSARSGTVGLREDLRAQLTLMGDSAPSYRRLLDELTAVLSSGEGRAIETRFERAWQRRSFASVYERPLLVFAALRSDAMIEGPSHPLYGALVPDNPDPKCVTPQALEAALAPDRIGLWIRLRSSRVQTNEVSRSIAWMWPASLVGCGGKARSLLLADIGCSAGLNLVADRVSVRWIRSDGGALEVDRNFAIRARLGFDARPLQVARPEDQAWLRACLWPGQTERHTRLEEAFLAFARASPAVELQLAQATSVPLRLAEEARAPLCDVTLAYQTLLRDYLPKDARLAYEEGMTEWLLQGQPGRRLWVELELSGLDPTWPCALDVRFNEGGRPTTLRLAHMGYHPTHVKVDEAATEKLRSLSRVA